MRVRLRDRAGCLESVEHRHPDVHQYDVGRKFSPRGRTASAPSASLTDHSQVGGRSRRAPEPRAYESLVIHDQNPNHESLQGKVAVTRKPPTGRRVAENSPP